MVKLDYHTATAADIIMEEQMRSIFQWEKSSGLEHSCYACNTKSNSPKALQTCYGTHSIPCSRYHQTMHAIGTSHNCDACIKADSLHNGRHRHVAELLAEYRSLEEDETLASKKNKKGTHPPTAPLHERADNLNTPSANRRQLPEPLDIENISIHSEEVENDNSPLSTSTSSTTPKPTKAELRASKRAAKQAKSEQKSLKNQSKHPVNVRSADVAHVHFILHGEAAHDQTGLPDTPYTPTTPAANANLAVGLPTDKPNTNTHEPASRHPLATDSTIEDVLQRNIGYVMHIRSHKAYLLRAIAGRKRAERTKRDLRHKRKNIPIKYDEDGAANFEDPEAEEDLDALVDAVLVKFCISVPDVVKNGGVSTPAKRALSSSTGGNARMGVVLAQLRVAIADDLKKHENEQRMTCIRAGGFWRYVGKGVFERMMEIGERIDWRTGVIRRGEAGNMGVGGEMEGQDVGGDEGVGA